MLWFKSLLNNLQVRRFTRHKSTLQPLLTREEIFDLYLRAKSSTPEVYSRDVAHRQIGDAPSLYRGIGMDYDDSRLYQIGDDQRYMNWRLSAKSGKLHMKVFREERRPSVFLTVDRRSNMRFGTRTRLKVTQAIRVAAMAGFTALQHNTSIAAVMLNSDLQWIDEIRGEQELFNLINCLNTPCPPELAHTGEPNFGDLLRTLDAMLIKGSTLYLISDFSDLNEQHRPILMQLSLKHNIIAIHIYDPTEKKLPDAGRLHLVDSKSQNEVSLDSSAPHIAKAYSDAAHDYFQNIENLFRTLGISYRQIASDLTALEYEVPAK